MERPYERKTYYFPRNVANSGKVFNGTLEKRNFIEAIILLLIGVFICRFFDVPSDKKFTLHIYICGPLFLIGLAGIQGLPVSTYLLSMLRWARNRKPMFLNPHAKAYDKRYADIALSEPQLGTMISDILRKAKDKYAVEKEYIEGKTYKFAEDPSWAYLEQGNAKPAEKAPKQESTDQELDLSDLISADYSNPSPKE